MFVLHELENILTSFIGSRQSRASQTRITLADIDRVDVEAMNIGTKIRLHPLDISHTLATTDTRHTNNLSWINNNNNELNCSSTDLLFANSIKSQLLDRILQMPTRAYPSARLLICDSKSLRLIHKFQYLASSNFLINRPPYNVTAILLLDDLVDVIDRLGRPLIKLKRDTEGNQVINYDYTIVKQVFPFLRISDLAIVLDELADLRLKTYTLDGKRSHQVIQFLTHFARSNQLIEFQSISKSLGQLHATYNNVSILNLERLDTSAATGAVSPQTPDVINFSRRFIANNHLTPQLAHLAPIGQRLLQLVNQQLGWSLESVTFRVGDPTGFSKIFAHILDSATKYAIPREQALQVNASARLLVLDRYFDIQGMLRHADTYGSYLDQEQSTTMLPDELERELRYEKLTNVLGAILRLTTSDKLIASNQSIRGHLDSIKSIYLTLQNGYLLLLKLEAAVESMLETMRNLTRKLDQQDQLEFAGRFKRIGEAFKQLINSAGVVPSLKVSDALRFACLLIDAISVHLYLNPNSPELKALVELKSELVFGEPFRLALKTIANLRGNDLEISVAGASSELDNNNGGEQNVARLADSLDVFDAISSERCATRSLLTLEEIMEHFYKRQLDSHSYPTIKLTPAGRLITTTTARAPTKRNNTKIVILMLGSLTYDELNRMKALELRLTRAPDILVLACDLIRPDEFIRSL